MRRGAKFAIWILALISAPVASLRAQGPPFQVDDPVPVDLHHYEFYIFGAMDGTPAETDSTGPAFEFNWGAIPRVQLHAILPWGVIAPSNNPIYAPGGAGTQAFGLTDMELGTKIAFFQETKMLPQIGTFTMFEMPTGSYSRGLGVGKAFSHASEGFAAPQTQASTLIDLGGYYHLKHHPGEQFLFCYGHSVAGQTENYAYLGLYWTWGKGGAQPNTSGLFPSGFLGQNQFQ